MARGDSSASRVRVRAWTSRSLSASILPDHRAAAHSPTHPLNLSPNHPHTHPRINPSDTMDHVGSLSLNRSLVCVIGRANKQTQRSSLLRQTPKKRATRTPMENGACEKRQRQ